MFMLMTLVSLAACVVMVLRRVGSARPRVLLGVQNRLVGLIALLAVGLLVYRLGFVHQGWQPLQAHEDGLLLMALLLAITILFLQAGGRLPGFSGFALPLLSLILAWGVCASWWTYRPFQIEQIWHTFHLTSVYLGTLSVAIGAVGGAMYLRASRRLRRRKKLLHALPYSSLETLERLIISSSAHGFALLTVGLATGLILHTSEPSTLGSGWWYHPKIVLSASAWLIYALVMNVRFATRFRGAKAAWLSIAGLLLLLAALASAAALSKASARESVTPAADSSSFKEGQR
jgi:ABC-type uncharacterized transport system permease subunit